MTNTDTRRWFYLWLILIFNVSFFSVFMVYFFTIPPPPHNLSPQFSLTNTVIHLHEFHNRPANHKKRRNDTCTVQQTIYPHLHRQTHWAEPSKHIENKEMPDKPIQSTGREHELTQSYKTQTQTKHDNTANSLYPLEGHRPCKFS